ncbi:glycosyltransferase family 4 protein [Chelatococcus sp. SYSU_G07232]|uniref:Glycosyltransferase family 4 protein n=1 Tax=Chelatococcus albus TaxID=3047466 RepID=A0ABT7AHS9_9HYPH|nr:glycosyltransferase family 4 protein [Chelatococcus sp. SYSU_G07232]MDJ1158186.1 glycosyltransferase family 4 protein [Chelatococcus sp. SYSU_G07232]
MRILMVNHYAITPDQSGGTRHFTLARELVRQGHSVTIVASGAHYQGSGGTVFAAGETMREEVVEGVRFLRLKTGGNQERTGARFLAMLDFARRLSAPLVRARIGTVDIVYGSSPHLFAALAAYRLSRRNGTPFVLEVRDLWPESIVALGNVSERHPIVLIMGAIARYLYRRSDRIVTLLPGSEAHILRMGGRRAGATTIPNFVDIDLHEGTAPPAARETFTITYAGTHGLANALDTLIDAAALARADEGLSHVRFRLVGAGREKERLRERARAAGLDNVSFDDPVPKQEIGRVLAEADAFYLQLKPIALYRHGTSLNKLFDYMAAARPVLFAADMPTNPIAACEAGITIPPEDPQALVQAIRRLVALPATERQAMGARARAHVIAHHGPRAMADRLIGVLRDAMAGAAAR